MSSVSPMAQKPQSSISLSFGLFGNCKTPDQSKWVDTIHLLIGQTCIRLVVPSKRDPRKVQHLNCQYDLHGEQKRALSFKTPMRYVNKLALEVLFGTAEGGSEKIHVAFDQSKPLVENQPYCLVIRFDEQLQCQASIHHVKAGFSDAEQIVYEHLFDVLAPLMRQIVEFTLPEKVLERELRPDVEGRIGRVIKEGIKKIPDERLAYLIKNLTDITRQSRTGEQSPTERYEILREIPGRCVSAIGEQGLETMIYSFCVRMVEGSLTDREKLALKRIAVETAEHVSFKVQS